MPLAGHDFSGCGSGSPRRNFNPRAPCGARRDKSQGRRLDADFNPRAPCGARPVASARFGTTTEFQSTCPLRGTTERSHWAIVVSYNFNPRAPCGARLNADAIRGEILQFQSTCPLRGTTEVGVEGLVADEISIHVPLAGHDGVRGRLDGFDAQISIHVPLAGHDPKERRILSVQTEISIHVPLAGHDIGVGSLLSKTRHFNPRAPCGARLSLWVLALARFLFQSTCPLRGTTLNRQGLFFRLRISIHVPLAGHDDVAAGLLLRKEAFQSTCPLRGTTGFLQTGEPYSHISIHVPLAGHDLRKPFIIAHVVPFQSTCPLRGTTAKRHKDYCAFL